VADIRDIAPASRQARTLAAGERNGIAAYGRKANMIKWKEQLNGDCPKRDAHSMLERRDLICPDLPNIL
jgi:hypothetical protein